MLLDQTFYFNSIQSMPNKKKKDNNYIMISVLVCSRFHYLVCILKTNTTCVHKSTMQDIAYIMSPV